MWIELGLAIIFAALFVALLLGFAGWRHPRQPAIWPSVLFLFLIMLFVIWAGGVSLVPYGPPIWGVYWAPFLIVGVFFTLFLLALGAMAAGDAHRPMETPAEAAHHGAVRGAAFSDF